MNQLFKAILLASLLIASAAEAVVIRGTGTSALIGGDLTDPENNGQPEANVGYNAVFRSSVNPGFGGAESAFNVFDNRVGGNNDKWCCNTNVWVEAEFGKQYSLTAFTAASANDVPGRDSDQWKILGSNDGVNYTTIFSYDNDGVSPWAQRLQVNAYSVGADFAAPAAYRIFRYQSTSVVSDSMHQLAELEFFGNEVPEPGSLALFGLALATLVLSLRKKQN